MKIEKYKVIQEQFHLIEKTLNEFIDKNWELVSVIFINDNIRELYFKKTTNK